MPRKTRREFFCVSLSACTVAVAGCSSTNRWSAGDLRINNNDSMEYSVQVKVSEVISEGEAKSATPTSGVDVDYRINKRYRVKPGATVKVGSVADPNVSGYVKVVAATENGSEIEWWISVPTRFIWEIDIASDGTLTWAYFGLE